MICLRLSKDCMVASERHVFPSSPAPNSTHIHSCSVKRGLHRSDFHSQGVHADPKVVIFHKETMLVASSFEYRRLSKKCSGMVDGTAEFDIRVDTFWTESGRIDRILVRGEFVDGTSENINIRMRHNILQLLFETSRATKCRRYPFERSIRCDRLSVRHLMLCQALGFASVLQKLAQEIADDIPL